VGGLATGYSRIKKFVGSKGGQGNAILGKRDEGAGEARGGRGKVHAPARGLERKKAARRRSATWWFTICKELSRHRCWDKNIIERTRTKEKRGGGGGTKCSSKGRLRKPFCHVEKRRTDRRRRDECWKGAGKRDQRSGKGESIVQRVVGRSHCKPPILRKENRCKTSEGAERRERGARRTTKLSPIQGGPIKMDDRIPPHPKGGGRQGL